MVITNFKEIRKGSLVAIFDVSIEQWGGLTLRQCAWFNKNGQQWINLPQKEYMSEGQKKYYPLVDFTKEVKDKLQDSVLQELAKVVEQLPVEAPAPSEDSGDDIPF